MFYQPKSICKMTVFTIPYEKYCVKCDKCNLWLHSSSEIGVCSHYEFWIDVLENKTKHFIDADTKNSCLSFTLHKGGFNNSRYNLFKGDKCLIKNVGLWHRGDAPQMVIKELPKITIKPYRE